MNLNSLLNLEAMRRDTCGCTLRAGDRVVVDGRTERGVIAEKVGRQTTVKFVGGEEVFDQSRVHRREK